MGGALEADIEEGVEGGWAILVLTNHEAVLELISEAVLRQKAAGAQKTDAVGGGVVGETNRAAVAWELVSVGGSVADVALDLGGDHLADDVLVREANDEAVLGSAELILVLGDKTLAGVVVGLAFTATLVLHLEALEVCLVLHHFDEPHGCVPWQEPPC